MEVDKKCPFIFMIFKIDNKHYTVLSKIIPKVPTTVYGFENFVGTWRLGHTIFEITLSSRALKCVGPNLTFFRGADAFF